MERIAMEIGRARYPGKRTIIFCLGLLACSYGTGSCVGETGAQFLKIGIGSRAAGMGDAFTAVADDPSAIYWNPAGMQRVKELEIMASHVIWLQGMSYQYGGGVAATRMGHLGVGISYSSSGEIPGRDEFLNETDDYSAYDFAGAVAYSRGIWTNMSGGIVLRVIQQKIEKESATGIAGDLGLLASDVGFQGLSCGLAIRNLGPDIKFVQEGDPLPLTVAGGLAFTHEAVTLSFDLSKERSTDLEPHLGGELIFLRALALRAGYVRRADQDDAFTAGVGLTWRRLVTEYALVPYGEIENTHRLSIRWGR
jgi:hypothetical protein